MEANREKVKELVRKAWRGELTPDQFLTRYNELESSYDLYVDCYNEAIEEEAARREPPLPHEHI